MISNQSEKLSFIVIGFVLILGSCAISKIHPVLFDPCILMDQILSERNFITGSSLKIFGTDSISILDKNQILSDCQLNTNPAFRSIVTRRTEKFVSDDVISYNLSRGLDKIETVVFLDSINFAHNIAEVYISVPTSNHHAYFKYRYRKKEYVLLEYKIGQY